LPQHVYAPENGYEFAAALAAAKAKPKPEPAEDSQASAERAYMQRFASGDLAREITYGYGIPTRAEYGAVADASNISQARLAKHVERFGPEGTEGLQRPSEGEKVVSGVIARRARKSGSTERRKTTSLLAHA
jgi:hypothetical protein